MATFFIGVDLHKGQFTCYFLNGQTGKGVWKKFLTTKRGYKLFIAFIRELKKQGYEIVVAVESTGNTRYFKRVVEREEVEIRVINTMKFKIVSESVNKTDKKDAKTIAEFAQKDILPEAILCSEKSEQLRRIVNSRKVLVNTRVKLKNQVHGILLGMGISTKSGQMNSKKGRKNVIEIVKNTSNKRLIEILINNIENIEEGIKEIEKEMEEMTEDDRAVEILRSISGTGLISAITVRAHIDDIARFSHYKKLSAFVGLVPWVNCSDKKIHYGNITKYGPEQCRTALVQMVLGMIKCKNEKNNILMIQYRHLKEQKGSGKALIAIARKLTKVIWTLLTKDEDYDREKLSAGKYLEKMLSMREAQRIKDAA